MAKSLQGATRLEHRAWIGVLHRPTHGVLLEGLRHPPVRDRTSEDDTWPEFDPAAFVRSAGTLYSLPKEGAGSAGPLVLTLTAATVGVLDEAVNGCRWRDFPDLYSNYGSRRHRHRLSRGRPLALA